ncbi:MAG: hypothetical protein ACPL1K_02595 [Candidatus Kryptoniota bacterium]
MLDKPQVQPRVKNVFTLYDFFGYFIPGVALLTALLLSRFAIDIKLLLAGKNDSSRFVAMLTQFKENWIVWITIGIVVTYLIGHVVSALSSMVLEKLVVGKILKYPTFNMLETTVSRAKNRKLKNYIMYNILLGYRGSMGNHTVEIFRTIFNAVFGYHGRNILDYDRFNVFPICFSYVKEKCPVTYERVMNYVSSYGFARNSAMAFIIAALLVICRFPVNYPYVLISSILDIVIALLLFRQYLKFLRRVNDEVFFQFMIINWHRLGQYMDDKSFDNL